MALSDIARWENRVALVTGASSGCGAAICKNLVKHGMTVIGCARRKERIDTAGIHPVIESSHASSSHLLKYSIFQINAKKLSEECRLLDYKGKLVSFKCDLTNEANIESMFAWIKQHHKGVDVCVNNAGLAIEEPLLECTAASMREMMDINVIAMVLCSKFTVKSMKERNVNDGHIVNINSMSGHRLTGKFNFYAGSKHAVTAVTEGLRRELVEKTRIRVTAISPGVIQSELLMRSFGEARALEMFSSMPHMVPQDIADAVVYSLSTPENVQVHDIQLRPTGAKV